MATPQSFQCYAQTDRNRRRAGFSCALLIRRARQRSLLIKEREYSRAGKKASSVGKNLQLLAKRDGGCVRILVVDDFVLLRRYVTSILQNEPGWHVVCEVSDGLEAVQKAEEMTPDLILLDIGLPKLNGIEAARQIRKLAPKSKILFLSEFGDLNVAREALNTGAAGYVVKSDAGSELLSAIKAVFQGKQFISSRLKGRISHDAEDPQVPETVRCHEVQFYSDDVVFLKTVTRFVGAALKAGNAAIVLATKPHRDSLLQGLKAQGVDVDAAIQQGAYVSLDAAGTLSTFMVNGWPDEIRFFESIGDVMQSASKAAKAEHPRVAFCGEGVALLWAEGKTGAAIRIEQLCNGLAETYQVDILCAYPFSLHIQEDEHAFGTICAEHSAVYSV